MARRVADGSGLFVAWQQVDNWVSTHRSSAPGVARALEHGLCGVPCAVWLCGEGSASRAREVVSRASARGQRFQFVLYNIPDRDCGGLSAGGACSCDAYMDWVAELARVIGDSAGIVVVEPDALAHASSAQADVRAARLDLLRRTVELLRRDCPAVWIYVDVGHPEWLPPNTAAELLGRAGVAMAAGFSLNIANMHTTSRCVEYAKKIASLLPGSPGYVIDVSRNGAGVTKPSNGAPVWLNNPGSRIGQRPTTNSGAEGCDGLLWLKVPGESDGEGDGAPSAGTFWPEGALRLLGGLNGKSKNSIGERSRGRFHGSRRFLS